jgi:hypothetical protein
MVCQLASRAQVDRGERLERAAADCPWWRRAIGAIGGHLERLPVLVESMATPCAGLAALAARSARAPGVATIRGALRGGRARSVSLLHLRGTRG